MRAVLLAVLAAARTSPESGRTGDPYARRTDSGGEDSDGGPRAAGGGRDACTPGDRRCEAGSVGVCAADGSGFVGLRAVGARFICNVNGHGPTEGCDASNDGEYGNANCSVWIDHGVRRNLPNNNEDCAGGNIAGCVASSCNEGVTYHAIECQCAQ